MVGYKNTAFKHIVNLLGYFLKGWGIFNQFIVDSGQRLDGQRNGTLRIHQRFEPIDDFMAVVDQDGNFSDTPTGCVTAGGFDVHNSVLDMFALLFHFAN